MLFNREREGKNKKVPALSAFSAESLYDAQMFPLNCDVHLRGSLPSPFPFAPVIGLMRDVMETPVGTRVLRAGGLSATGGGISSWADSSRRRNECNGITGGGRDSKRQTHRKRDRQTEKGGQANIIKEGEKQRKNEIETQVEEIMRGF